MQHYDKQFSTGLNATFHGSDRQQHAFGNTYLFKNNPTAFKAQQHFA